MVVLPYARVCKQASTWAPWYAPCSTHNGSAGNPSKACCCSASTAAMSAALSAPPSAMPSSDMPSTPLTASRTTVHCCANSTSSFSSTSSNSSRGVLPLRLAATARYAGSRSTQPPYSCERTALIGYMHSLLLNFPLVCQMGYAPSRWSWRGCAPRQGAAAAAA